MTADLITTHCKLQRADLVVVEMSVTVWYRVNMEKHIIVNLSR